MTLLDKVITVNEASELSGLSPQNITYHCSKGHYECRQSGKNWLITRKSFERYHLNLGERII